VRHPAHALGDGVGVRRAVRGRDQRLDGDDGLVDVDAGLDARRDRILDGGRDRRGLDRCHDASEHGADISADERSRGEEAFAPRDPNAEREAGDHAEELREPSTAWRVLGQRLDVLREGRELALVGRGGDLPRADGRRGDDAQRAKDLHDRGGDALRLRGLRGLRWVETRTTMRATADAPTVPICDHGIMGFPPS
jgi:hypothetical protein